MRIEEGGEAAMSTRRIGRYKGTARRDRIRLPAISVSDLSLGVY
jgi:hypothetical protein